MTGALRSQLMPDIPTVAESVRGYEASIWFGIGAPGRTPPQIVERLGKEINAGLADPQLKARFADLGAVAFVESPSGFARFIAEETDKWAKVVSFAGLKAE